jgi:hypothetical protein
MAARDKAALRIAAWRTASALFAINTSSVSPWV